MHDAVELVRISSVLLLEFSHVVHVVVVLSVTEDTPKICPFTRGKSLLPLQ